MAAAKEDETKEWADNQPAALIGNRSFFSTADDAALSIKFPVENVRVIFGNEAIRIDTRVLDSKEKSDIIDDKDDSAYESNTEDDEDSDDYEVVDEDAAAADTYYKRQMQRVINNGKVTVGALTSFQLEDDDMDLIDVLEYEIPSYANWMKVQGVPYKTYTGGLYDVFCAKDLKEMYKDLIDEFLLRVVRHLGVKDVDNIQHFVTFLSSQRDKKSKKFHECLQQYHRDFRPEEIANSQNQWYIAFIPMKEYGMKIKVEHNENHTLYNIPFKTGVLMNVNTVHAGGYCDDEEFGNLRMQIHFSIDRKHAPLPTIIRQEHVVDNSHEEEIKAVSL